MMGEVVLDNTDVVLDHQPQIQADDIAGAD